MPNNVQDHRSKPERIILVINGGSSSVKFAVFRAAEPLQAALRGKLDRIGLPGTKLTWSETEQNGQPSAVQESSGPTGGKSSAEFLMQFLERHVDVSSLQAVGHRVVHGMEISAPTLISPEILDQLRRVGPLDPDHIPSEIALIEEFQKRFPAIPQVACFDTAFHRTLPRVAKLLPIPRRFDTQGVQRYGFHGLSYAFLMEELERIAGSEVARGRVILAHLGSGASLAAVRDGKSVDTSMGFTPTGGIPMGTRTGDLDPGVAWQMMQSEKLTAEQFTDMVNHKSGLLGVSETSSDLRDLIAHQAADVRAAEAVELFCYQVRKWIGAFAAVLGGVDTLVFAGGIGENLAEVRERVCRDLGFLGIVVDETRNASHAAVISKGDNASRVTVRVIHTDEEQMIARDTYQLTATQAG